MSLKSFLFKFILTVAFFTAAIFGFDYYQNKKSGGTSTQNFATLFQEQLPASKDASDGAGALPDAGKMPQPLSEMPQEQLLTNQGVLAAEDGAVAAVPQTKESGETEVVASAGNARPAAYVPVHSESGDFKSIAADNGSITITANGKEYRAIITAKTEVMRNASKATLADIKENDTITIMGHKDQENSADFIADSIFASAQQNAPVPSLPVEALGAGTPPAEALINN